MSKVVVAVVSLGSGNITSLVNALARVGAIPTVARQPSEVPADAAIVFPGVGSLPNYMAKLRDIGFAQALATWRRQSRDILAICAGMQALGLASSENGGTEGLGIADSQVVHLRDLGVVNARVPNIGWRELLPVTATGLPGPLAVLQGRDVYYMHSYAFPPDCPGVAALSCHGVHFAAAIWMDSILGVQFHPEKSQSAGLDFLRAWLG